MLVPITYYKCNICGKTDNTERPGLLERLKSMFVTLPRGPFYVPIPSFCDACFHKRFPRGLDEANAVAQDYLDRIRSDANLYDEYKSKLYAIVDVAINRFLEQYAPIDCDKNLLKMICLKHGGGAQLVQDRNREFFAGITKKLHDAIKATGGYPQSPQNQDVCHYRKGKQ